MLSLERRLAKTHAAQGRERLPFRIDEAGRAASWASWSLCQPLSVWVRRRRFIVIKTNYRCEESGTSIDRMLPYCDESRSHVRFNEVMMSPVRGGGDDVRDSLVVQQNECAEAIQRL